jgi:hypothetical protein
MQLFVMYINYFTWKVVSKWTVLWFNIKTKESYLDWSKYTVKPLSAFLTTSCNKEVLISIEV